MGYKIFLKYEMILEKHLTKLQNLTLYYTNLKLSYILSKIGLTHVSHIALKPLDPSVEKWEDILHKKQTNFLRSRTLLFWYTNFQVLTTEQFLFWFTAIHMNRTYYKNSMNSMSNILQLRDP